MPEWLVERGIGETREALVDGDQVIEARILLDGVARFGSLLRAQLVNVGAAGRNAIARAEDGTEFLLPRGAPGATEGAAVTIEVTREAIPGSEPWKRPLARVSAEPPREAPATEGRELPFPTPHDELAEAGWNDLLEQARGGIVRFDGGELRISATPAMTLVDIDGPLPPDELAVRGAAEAARAIRRLDIGGSIGIDLPTAGSKAVRQSAAAAIDQVLQLPFERTAVNGFGFVQIVRPRRRASLVELAAHRPSFEARALMRLAAFEAPGAKRLVAHPAVIAEIEQHPGWLPRLGVVVGGVVSLRSDPALPISAGYAEAV